MAKRANQVCLECGETFHGAACPLCGNRVAAPLGRWVAPAFDSTCPRRPVMTRLDAADEMTALVRRMLERRTVDGEYMAAIAADRHVETAGRERSLW